MAELNETYVVHTATIRCSMGMRETYLVLDNTHGVFLRQQPQMTVNDSVPGVNVRCFGGCYSMENPATKAQAESIQRAVEERCPDTFLDSVLKWFTGNKKEVETQQALSHCEAVVVQVFDETHSHMRFEEFHKMRFAVIGQGGHIVNGNVFCVMLLYIFQYRFHFFKRFHL